MKYIRFVSKDNTQQVGILRDDNTIDLVDGDILCGSEPTGQRCSVDDIARYLPPVDSPNVIALGLNYVDHASESKMQVPEVPLVFIKATTAITGHKCDIVLPRQAPSEVDYEAELGVIIGKTAKNIEPEKVDEYIFGYTCVNDVSARDCQLRIDSQWARGKSFDTFAPMGPVVETELDPSDLRIRLLLNGEVMQDASTKDMIFGVRETISFLSKNMTLLAGTLVMTGTPPGVGFARKPAVFLRAGDEVVVDIEGLDNLVNTVVAE